MRPMRGASSARLGRGLIDVADVEIPDEAFDALEAARLGSPNNGEAVRVAAPHIARAAVVAELERWAKKLDESAASAKKWSRDASDIEGQERCEHEHGVYKDLADDVRDRITLLSAAPEETP